MKRRRFIKLTSFALASIASLEQLLLHASTSQTVNNQRVILSTWDLGVYANARGMEVMDKGRSVLDAVEEAVKVNEANPDDTSVGYGGLPDREGRVTLDASIMDHQYNCGSVAFVQGYKHVISIARRVMEKTPHVFLAGKGAELFAESEGFIRENLLTEASKKAWEKWLKETKYQIQMPENNHDTIGLLARDENGTIAGACTTSGWAFKLHGRVGDSPVIGAGLYCDGKYGAATATGKGEAVIKINGSHLICEMMRQGKSPQTACEIAIQRIAETQKDYKDFQVAFIALSRDGEIGVYALQKGFQYSLFKDGLNKAYPSAHLL